MSSDKGHLHVTFLCVIKFKMGLMFLYFKKSTFFLERVGLYKCFKGLILATKKKTMLYSCMYVFQCCKEESLNIYFSTIYDVQRTKYRCKQFIEMHHVVVGWLVDGFNNNTELRRWCAASPYQKCLVKFLITLSKLFMMHAWNSVLIFINQKLID